jgi:hypothetical protein
MTGSLIKLPRLRNVPPKYVDAIRLMAEALQNWTIDHPERPPRFALPPAGIVVAIKYVWPVFCQNTAARDLFHTFQDIGRVVGGEGLDPTLTQAAIAIRAVGVKPEIKSVQTFLDCAKELGFVVQVVGG